MLTLISGWLVLSVLLAAVWSMVGRRVANLNGESTGVASPASAPEMQATAR